MNTPVAFYNSVIGALKEVTGQLPGRVGPVPGKLRPSGSRPCEDAFGNWSPGEGPLQRKPEVEGLLPLHQKGFFHSHTWVFSGLNLKTATQAADALNVVQEHAATQVRRSRVKAALLLERNFPRPKERENAGRRGKEKALRPR